ncbi:Uncharacterised protein [Dermatophilus congolensis]|uniref:Uncharacterized protein n=1 Tax=Dermatophilus congolensis TaxID=1863 RepID=A0AA46BLW6_9MICO|nr:hypothetical protein [Dermatophilus congolensis]STD05615.1 Uncharacterised protein [Dermatophilus congolensis]
MTWPVPARALRACGVASSTTFMALFMHAFAGGGVPPVLVVVVTWMCGFLIAMPLVGRWRAWWSVAVPVLVGQFAFHLFFELGALIRAAHEAGAAGKGYAASAWMKAADLHALCALTRNGSGAAALRGQLHHGAVVPNSGGVWGVMSMSPLMVAGHVFAAAVCVVLVRSGEELLIRLLELGGSVLDALRPVLCVACPVLMPAAARVAVGTAAVKSVMLREYLAACLVRRGPPICGGKERLRIRPLDMQITAHSLGG